MNDWVASGITLFTALGLGGVMGAYFQARFQQRTQVEQQQRELKQKRYLCILILMITKLNPSVGLPKIKAIRPELHGSKDVDDELATELLNAIIFASDDTLQGLIAFMRAPSTKYFVDTANAMRQDLWGKMTHLGSEIFDTIGNTISNLSKTAT